MTVGRGTKYARAGSLGGASFGGGGDERNLPGFLIYISAGRAIVPAALKLETLLCALK